MRTKGLEETIPPRPTVPYRGFRCLQSPLIQGGRAGRDFHPAADERKDHAARAGGPLVNGRDEAGHGADYNLPADPEGRGVTGAALCREPRVASIAAATATTDNHPTAKRVCRAYQAIMSLVTGTSRSR